MYGRDGVTETGSVDIDSGGDVDITRQSFVVLERMGSNSGTEVGGD